MSLLETAMQIYAYLFHPAVALGLGALLAIHWEWARRPLDRSALYRRWGTFLGAGALSLLPSAAYMLVTGSGPVETMQGNGAQVDTLVAGGILAASGVTWALWRRFDWGDVTPHLMATYAVVSIPYVALSPFWNVSGHVLLSFTPALFLTLLDRRFWPALLVAAVMGPNRLVLGAHQPAQVVGAYVVGL
ncbi:phosphatase PAP2 family protein, partial [Halobium palmae]